MARQFSFGTVFRMTEKPFLKSFFETFGADIELVPWDKLKRNDIDALLKLFDKLPPDKRDEAEVVLRHVHALSCEQGVQALGEAADELHTDESWGEVYLSEKNLYTKAMSAWLTHREIFDHAVRFYEMDSLSWWRKQIDLPKITPVFDETVKKNLENELEQFFRTKQGRGFVCTAEMFTRSNGTYYFYARPDDYVRDTFVHDKDKHLVRQPMRPTMDIVFVYDSIAGTCNLSAKLSGTIKTAVESVFLRHILNVSPPETEKQVFDLSVLLDPNFVPATLPEDNIDVYINGLKFQLNKKYAIEHTAQGSQSVSELVCQSTNEYQSRKGVDVVVKQARFRFVFNNVPGRAKTMTFSISSLDTCDLKNQQPDRIEKAHHYLKKWRIENDSAQRLSHTAANIAHIDGVCQTRRTGIDCAVSQALAHSETY
ncbi:hypothetical protein FACS1894189_1110 [Planctomycetales bacterium]|nr:hypothetical protein FACS1894189_1110 [Planctomycetales bacterium]